MNIQSVADAVSLIDAPEESLVVDLGCGNGSVANSIKQKGYRVIGVDDSVNKLVQARKQNPKINFILGTPENFKLSESADVIFSDSLMRNVDEENQLKMLKNLKLNLKDGGSLICEFFGDGTNSFIHYALWDNFAEHGLMYEIPDYFPSLDEYEKLLNDAGFKIDKADVVSCPMDQKSSAEIEKWINDNFSRAFENLDEKLKKDIISKTLKAIKEVSESDRNFSVDYVKIRIKAEKAAA